MRHQPIIIAGAIVAAIAAGAIIATPTQTAAQISAQNDPQTPQQPFTARYQVIDDLTVMQARIDALEAELHAMRTEAGWQRSEDLKRLYRLELAVYGLDGWGCIP